MCWLLDATFKQMQESIKMGKHKFDARNDAQVYRARDLSKAYAEYFVLLSFRFVFLVFLPFSPLNNSRITGNDALEMTFPKNYCRFLTSCTQFMAFGALTSIWPLFIWEDLQKVLNLPTVFVDNY